MILDPESIKKKIEKERNSQNKFALAMVLGLELGFAISLPLVGFLLLGLWIDKKFGTIPLFTIIFLIAGMIGVVVELKMLIMPFLEKRSQKKEGPQN